jgi:hypothetical protein
LDYVGLAVHQPFAAYHVPYGDDPVRMGMLTELHWSALGLMRDRSCRCQVSGPMTKTFLPKRASRLVSRTTRLWPTRWSGSVPAAGPGSNKLHRVDPPKAWARGPLGNENFRQPRARGRAARQISAPTQGHGLRAADPWRATSSRQQLLHPRPSLGPLLRH